MKFITTKLERQAEVAQHPNQTKYKIFSVDGDAQTLIEMFWASSKEEAYNHLLEYRKTSGRDDVYFDEVYRNIFENEDGTETVCDSLHERFNLSKSDEDDEDDSPYKRCRSEKEYMVKDFKFFIDHYDIDSNSSHMRSESWSLDTHILDDIAFNVPIIKADKNGVPQQYLDEARKRLKDNKTDNLDDSAFELAKKLWNDELDVLLHHVWMYQYYSDYGIESNKDSEEKKAYVKQFNIPQEKGKYDVVDYRLLSELQQTEWKAIWVWMSEHGQSLWT